MPGSIYEALRLAGRLDFDEVFGSGWRLQRMHRQVGHPQALLLTTAEPLKREQYDHIKGLLASVDVTKLEPVMVMAPPVDWAPMFGGKTQEWAEGEPSLLSGKGALVDLKDYVEPHGGCVLVVEYRLEGWHGPLLQQQIEVLACKMSDLVQVGIYHWTDVRHLLDNKQTDHCAVVEVFSHQYGHLGCIGRDVEEAACNLLGTLIEMPELRDIEREKREGG